MTYKQLNDKQTMLLAKAKERRNIERKTAEKVYEAYSQGVRNALGECLEFVEKETPHDQPLTNLDRMRAMSAEEMADRIIGLGLVCISCPVTTLCLAYPQGGSECRQHIVEWLNSPAKEDSNA